MEYGDEDRNTIDVLGQGGVLPGLIGCSDRTVDTVVRDRIEPLCLYINGMTVGCPNWYE